MAADLEFRIGAELTEIKGALAALRRDFASVGSVARNAGGQQAFAGIEGSAAGALRSVGRLVGGFFALQTALSLIKKADELTSLNARLKLVTTSQEEFNGTQNALFELSQRTRSELGATIALYTRIGLAVKDAGVGQGVLLEVVETINKAVQLSGSSSAAAEAALVQLGQGLASGTLRGEELNSILEQTPALADAIAKGMGKTRGELRALGQEGKLSAQAVIKALQEQKQAVDNAFDTLPVTVAQGVTLIQNAGLQLLGIFDQVSGATGGLAKTLKSFSEFLSSDEVAGSVAAFGEIFAQYFGLAGEAIEGLVDIAGGALDLLNRTIEAELGAALDEAEAFSGGISKVPRTVQDVIALVIRAFKELPANIKALVGIVVVTVAAAFDKLASDAQELKDVIAAIFSDDTIDEAVKRAKARSKAIEDARRETIDGIFAERDAALGAIEAVEKATIRSRQKARDFKGSTAQGKFTTPVNDADRKKAEALRKAQLEAEEKLERDSADRIKGYLADYYADGLVSAQAYYDARLRLELASLERQIAIAKAMASSASDPAAKEKARAEIELLERQKTDIAYKAARDRVADARELDKQLEQARIQDLQNAGRSAEAAKLSLEAQYRDLIKRLEAEGNVAGAALIRKLIDTGVAKAQFDDIKREFDRVVAEFEARNRSLVDQRDTGAIPIDTAAEQTRVAREQAIAQLTVINEKLQELAARTNDPAIIEGARAAGEALKNMGRDGATGLEAAIINLRASLANIQAGFAQAATGAGVDAITGLFTDLASGTKTAGEALRDFVRNFAQSMAQIAARALATFLVLQLLDAIYPGLGRLTAASASVGVAHTGGMVGSIGTQRSVNPLLFVGAPRFHNGGMIGLAPNERPIIAKLGEEVLSPSDPRNAKNGGGQPAMGGGVRIINTIDPNLVQDFMASAAGERTILNTIERNAGAVRQKLA